MFLHYVLYWFFCICWFLRFLTWKQNLILRTRDGCLRGWPIGKSCLALARFMPFLLPLTRWEDLRPCYLQCKVFTDCKVMICLDYDGNCVLCDDRFLIYECSSCFEIQNLLIVLSLWNFYDVLNLMSQKLNPILRLCVLAFQSHFCWL